MAPHIRDLVVALLRRMQSAQIVGLRSSLLLIFARLVCTVTLYVCKFPQRPLRDILKPYAKIYYYFFQIFPESNQGIFTLIHERL